MEPACCFPQICSVSNFKTNNNNGFSLRWANNTKPFQLNEPERNWSEHKSRSNHPTISKVWFGNIARDLNIYPVGYIVRVATHHLPWKPIKITTHSTHHIEHVVCHVASCHMQMVVRTCWIAIDEWQNNEKKMSKNSKNRHYFVPMLIKIVRSNCLELHCKNASIHIWNAHKVLGMANTRQNKYNLMITIASSVFIIDKRSQSLDIRRSFNVQIQHYFQSLWILLYWCS